MLDRVMSYRPLLPASQSSKDEERPRARARIGPTGKHQQLIRPRLVRHAMCSGEGRLCGERVGGEGARPIPSHSSGRQIQGCTSGQVELTFDFGRYQLVGPYCRYILP